MKNKGFGHLKTRLFTIKKTSKHVGLGGPWHISLEIILLGTTKCFFVQSRLLVDNLRFKIGIMIMSSNFITKLTIP